MKNENVHRRYNDEAKARFAEDDFLGQVARTVDGKAVDSAQHEMIINQIVGQLALESRDVVLDLACGNGLVTDRIFERCCGGVGVDFSEYLIDVAKRHFERPGIRDYVLSDVVDFVTNETDADRFSKGLCYGSFAYLSSGDAEVLLSCLRSRFSNIGRFFIGNLPNKERLADYYSTRAYEAGIEDEHDSAIGLWRTPQECIELGKRTGWRVTIAHMPAEFFNAYYRFDALFAPLE